MASPALRTCPARPPPAMALTGMGVADSLGLSPVIQRASRTFKCPCIMVLPQPCRPTPGGLGGQTTPAAIQGRQSWALVRGLLAGRGQNPLPTYGYSPTTHSSSVHMSSHIRGLQIYEDIFTGRSSCEGLGGLGRGHCPSGQCVRGGRKIRAFLFWVFFFKGACLSM